MVEAQGSPWYKVVKVVDGDGITVVPTTVPNPKTRIRLACIDAPELTQLWGPQAKQALENLVPIGSIVKLSGEKKDPYGRRLALVHRAGDAVSVNVRLVEKGMAFVYCFFMDELCSPFHDFYAAEASSREVCVGVWSIAGGITRPWNYRQAQKHRNPFPDACPVAISNHRCSSAKITESPTVPVIIDDDANDPLSLAEQERIDDILGPDGEEGSSLEVPPPPARALYGAGWIWLVFFVALVTIASAVVYKSPRAREAVISFGEWVRFEFEQRMRRRRTTRGDGGEINVALT